MKEIFAATNAEQQTVSEQNRVLTSELSTVKVKLHKERAHIRQNFGVSADELDQKYREESDLFQPLQKQNATLKEQLIELEKMYERR